MGTGKAIIVAAMILGVCYVAANLYKLEPVPQGGVYRLNAVTGKVAFCALGDCIVLNEK